MSDVRAIDIVASFGMFDMNLAVLRYLEERINAWTADEKYDDPLVVEVKRLIFEQIVGLELQDNFLVIGPYGRVYRVTKEE
jgi:hypothetical protein